MSYRFAVERSLSDNKNICTKELVNLIPEKLIGLRRMKQYARSKGGAHCIHVSDKMLEGVAGYLRKRWWESFTGKQGTGLAAQNFKKIKEKEKEKKEPIKEAAASKKISGQK